MAVQSVPQGYHTLTPYLVVNDARGLIDFIKRVFGAEQIAFSEEDGRVLHSEFRIGDSPLMLSQASELYPAMPAMLYVYLDDVDTIFQRAVDAGGTPLREVRNESYGDRTGGIADKFGNQWWIASRIQ